MPVIAALGTTGSTILYSTIASAAISAAQTQVRSLGFATNRAPFSEQAPIIQVLECIAPIERTID